MIWETQIYRTCWTRSAPGRRQDLHQYLGVDVELQEGIHMGACARNLTIMKLGHLDAMEMMTDSTDIVVETQTKM